MYIWFCSKERSKCNRDTKGRGLNSGFQAFGFINSNNPGIRQATDVEICPPLFNSSLNNNGVVPVCFLNAA